MKGPRYIVASVTGYAEAEGSHHARPRTDYMVQDTDYCYRVVAYFSSRGHLHRADHRKRKAQALADSLNRGEQAWRDALARDAELTA